MIKKQKILRFIPIVNLVSAYIWMYFSWKYSEPTKNTIKLVLKVFLVTIVLVIPRIIVAKLGLIHIVCKIVEYVTLYITLFLISTLCIKEQEKILERNKP